MYVKTQVRSGKGGAENLHLWSIEYGEPKKIKKTTDDGREIT